MTATEQAPSSADLKENLEFVRLPQRLELAITGTPNELANIIFLSYRFSQNTEPLQDMMLEVIQHNLHPDLLEPDNAQYEEARRLADEKVINYFVSDRAHPTARATPNAVKDGEN